MSHEIRTPMTGVMGFADLLLEDNLPASSKDKIYKIKDATWSLLRIINDILDMSKMEGVRMVRLAFDTSVEQIERLNRLTGLVETLRTSDGEDGARVLDIQLEGGTGDLFKWSNGNPWALRGR